METLGLTQYEWIEILRIAIAIPFLIYASYKDYKTRKIPNYIWNYIIFGGIILLVMDIVINPEPSKILIWSIGNILIASWIAFILHYSKAFGGADIRFIIAISIIFPTYPEIANFPIMLPKVIDNSMIFINSFIIPILGNSALIAIIYYPLRMILQNIKDRNINIKKPGLMITSHKLNINNINNINNEYGKVLPETKSNSIIERINNILISSTQGVPLEIIKDYRNWGEQNFYTPIQYKNLEDTDNIIKFLKENEKWNSTSPKKDAKKLSKILEKNNVWVMEGIPLILSLTLGLIVAITFGSIPNAILYFLFS